LLSRQHIVSVKSLKQAIPKTITVCSFFVVSKNFL